MQDKAKKVGMAKTTKKAYEHAKTLKLKFCPACKTASLTAYSGFITGSYQCKNCGYVGSFFIEKIAKAKQMKK